MVVVWCIESKIVYWNDTQIRYTLYVNENKFITLNIPLHFFISFSLSTFFLFFRHLIEWWVSHALINCILIGYKSWKWRHHIRRFTYTFVNTCASLTELEIAERGRKGREGKERKGREREGKRREGGGGNRQINKDLYMFSGPSRDAQTNEVIWRHQPLDDDGICSPGKTVVEQWSCF